MTATLGDLLGRLADPPRVARFEPERMALVDQLVSAGEGAASSRVWLEAFERSVDQVVATVVASADRRLTEAAQRSRLPARRLAAQQPDAEYQDQLRHRLLATAMPLEQLDAATPSPDTTRRRAMALEGAWEEVLLLSAAEERRWSRVADQIAEWRRPTGQLWVATVVSLLLTLVVAVWLGGLVRPPTWFRPVVEGFWALPWWR